MDRDVHFLPSRSLLFGWKLKSIIRHAFAAHPQKSAALSLICGPHSEMRGNALCCYLLLDQRQSERGFIHMNARHGFEHKAQGFLRFKSAWRAIPLHKGFA